MTAAEGLRAAVLAALAEVEGLGAHDPGPVQAAWPFAEVHVPGEADWSHKGGEGRELRLAVAVRDRGERPGRMQALLGAAEDAVAAIAADAAPGWRIVSLRFERSRTARGRSGEWVGAAEFRARMLRLDLDRSRLIQPGS